MRRSVPSVCLFLVVAACFVPVASASTQVCAPYTGLVFACAGDVSAGSGSCETQGYAFGYDHAYVISPVGVAYVYAGGSCYRDATLSQEATVIDGGVYTPLVAAAFHWSEVQQSSPGGEYASCTMFVTVGTALGWNSLEQPCVAPPPNPGWGHLLS